MRNISIALLIFVLLGAFLSLWTGCHGGPAGDSQVEEKKQEPPQQEKESGTISLTPEQIKVGGIETEILKLQTVDERAPITGELKAATQREVKITSRNSGKVLRLLAQEGDRVMSNQPLAVIESVELAQTDASFHQAETEFEISRKNLARVNDMAKLGIFSKSTLEEAQNSAAQSRAAMEGAQADLLIAQKQYDRSKELQGAGLASMKDLERSEADLTKARADVEKARVNLNSSESRLKREELNYRRGHLTYKEVFEAEQAFRQAQARFKSARSAMEILGVSEENHGRTFTVTSPIQGIISSLQISQGEGIVPTTPLMTVVDTRVLWLLADIYEKDLGKIKLGQKAIFTVAAYPKKSFRGRVSYISPTMEEKTRTVKARIEVPNVDLSLKVNMFARGWIFVDSKRQALLVPLGAIQKSADQDVVYVQKESPGTFAPQKVSRGEVFGDREEILEGVKVGSIVVVKGSFMVKSEEQKSSLEGEE